METEQMMKIENLLQDVEAVIFDLDGTLVDSMWLWHDIDVEYFKRFNLTLPDDYQKRIEGMSFTETAVFTKNEYGIPDSLDKIMHDWNEMAYECYMRRVVPKNGASEFLKLLHKKGIKMGVATSNSHEIVDPLCKKLGFMEYLSCIITGCDVNKGKPAPDVYLKVAEILDVLPEKCLVFEDIPAGIMAGKNAGMHVCAIADEYSAYQLDEKKSLADYFIEDYTELCNIL